MDEIISDGNGKIISEKIIHGTPPNRWFGKGTLIDCFLTSQGWGRINTLNKPEMQVLTYILDVKI